MRNGHTLDARKVAGWSTMFGGLCVLTFWILYFASEATLGHDNSGVARFEAAFLVADVLFAGMLLTSGFGLLRRKACGGFCLVAAASMSVYLALLDLTFYSREGLYFPLSSSALLELIVNGLCLVGGVLGLRWGWLIWQQGRSR
jgi:hypothetical protein